LKLWSTGERTRKGSLPEVPERRPTGERPTGCESAGRGPRSRGRRGGPRRRAKGGCGGRSGRGREGECPREGEAQESQEAAGPWRHGGGIPTGRGSKPLQRGRAGPAVRSGGHRGRGTGDPGTRATRRSRKVTGHGRGTGEVVPPIGSARWVARGREPIARREATPRGARDSCQVKL
jgi:hypothetical protein